MYILTYTMTAVYNLTLVHTQHDGRMFLRDNGMYICTKLDGITSQKAPIFRKL